MDRSQKEEQVKEISEIFDGSGSVVMAEYSGMTVAEMTDLRAKLREHERNAHSYVHGLGSVHCPSCAVAKDLNKTSHRSERPEHHKAKEFGDCFDFDFKGPLKESYFGARYIMAGIDQFTSWVGQYPIATKDLAGGVLERCNKENQFKIRRARSDNEPVLKGDGSEWRLA